MSEAMYQVICREHGKQALTEPQYVRMLDDPDSAWKCPVCGDSAEWDDDSGVTSGDGGDEPEPNPEAIKVCSINVDGSVEPFVIDLPQFSYQKIVGRLKDTLGDDIELVAVLFNGKPATLIVNAVGASTDPEINPNGQLPINARASLIYWTATIKGMTPSPFEPLSGPLIHGPAILIEVDKRRL